MISWKQRRKKYRYSFSPSGSTKKLPKSKNIAKIAKYSFIAVLIGFIGLFLVFPLLAFNLPSPDKIVRREGFSTKILDRNGEVLYDIYADQRRTPIDIENVPDYLKHATVAIEDKNFYKHSGFDPIGMIRGVSRLFTRGRAQGGSTLTQQLVKNVLLSPERTVIRKIKEFVLAVQIENRYSKDEILQMYLNEAPYGGTAWGVEAAAEVYFGKAVKDLNLIESAFLAGLPQRPSVYSPYSSTPDSYKFRTEEVLRRMREDGYITKEQEEEAKNDLENLQFQDRADSFKAPHFVQYVQKILEERYGERIVEQGGLKVTTTLDLKLQEEAQDIVREEIEEIEYLNVTNGSAVVMDPETGEILAMVGSADFNDSDNDGQFNVATQGMRQPGSALKPIVYAAALQKGYTASTLLMDVPTEFPGGQGNPPYKPVNYDGKFRGPVQVRYALANSINIPAVKMIALVGVKDVLELAHEMGIESLEPTNELLKRVGLSLALGGGELKLIELTTAYAPFMNQGFKVDPVAVLSVEDRDGKVIEKVDPKKGKSVLSSEESYIIANILSDNEARSEVFGTNSLLNIPGWEIAVKTGTTNDKRDNWTVGGNPHVVVGVWVGNNDFSEMKQVASGITGASPIWRRIILEALNSKPKVSFTRPDGIVTLSVDKISGYREHDGFPSRTEIFAKGTEPGDDPVHVKLKICKNEGKLATPSDIAAGNYEEKEFFIFKEEDPLAPSGSENMWQKGVLEWIGTQNNPLYNPPTEYCSGINSAPLNVEFVSPRDRDSDLDNELKIKFTIDSIHGVKEAYLEIDGNKIRSFTAPPYEHEITLKDGIHKLRAVAKDNEGNESDRRITIGINSAWDASPTPSASPASTP